MTTIVRHLFRDLLGNHFQPKRDEIIFLSALKSPNNLVAELDCLMAVRRQSRHHEGCGAVMRLVKVYVELGLTAQY